MSESNNVYENFEDALFRLFMDRVAAVEGERLLRENEELKSDPDAAVPEDVQKRVLHSIRKGIAQRDRKATGKTVKKIVRFLPLVAIIAILMGMVAYAAFPAFRASILNLLMTENERYTTWEYRESNELIPPENVLSFDVVLPDEYYLVKSEKNEVSELAVYQSKFDQNKSLSISLQYGDNSFLRSDNEDTDYYEELTIQGQPAVLIEKDGNNALIISDNSLPYFIVLNSNSMAREELCHIAENIYFIE